MKLFIKHINMIAVIVMLLSGLCLDSSDIAIRLCLISTLYLCVYASRRAIAKAVYAVIRYYADEVKAVMEVKR